MPGRPRRPLEGAAAPALDRLAGAIDAVTVAVAGGLPGMGAPGVVWAARDGYVDVVIGPSMPDAFAAEHLGLGSTAEDRRRLLELLEAQRWRLAMFASDGWYWDDPERPETRQVLRSAARAARLIDGIAGTSLEAGLVADLAALRSPVDGDRRRDDLPARAGRGRTAAALGLAPGTSGGLPAVHGACNYRCQR